MNAKFKGNDTGSKSYRPICVLGPMGKLYESIRLARLEQEIKNRGGVSTSEISKLIEVVQRASVRNLALTNYPQKLLELNTINHILSNTSHFSSNSALENI
ncbi:hypothetical protein ABEB36_004767 [Hypothenemus hampei]|uniref:Uncharacterized protein n=1 Tax=Hypothenemus hampei TaxID=57062 RepID=A0ABD1EWS6_HYPHA